MASTLRRRFLALGLGGAFAVAAARLTGRGGPTAVEAATDPWFDVLAFGAKGDGVTDDTAAIQAALAAAASGSLPFVGGIVFMPRGTYMISSRLAIPWRVSLVGVGRDATTIKALASFPTGTELVRLGDTSNNIGEACRIENLTVDCSGISASTGIYSERMQEQCGVFRCLIMSFGAFGIQVNEPPSGAPIGPPQHWSIDDVEIFTGSTTPATAIGLAVTMRTAAMPIRQISRVTVFASTFPITTAIRLDGLAAGRVSDVHVEGCTNGLLVGSTTNCWASVFMNLDGNSNVTNLLVWSNAGTQQSLVAIGLSDAGATNTLVDQISGVTLTGPVAFHAVGQGGPTDHDIISTAYTQPVRLRRVQVLRDLRRSVLTPSYTASFTPDASAAELYQMNLAGDVTVNPPTNSAPGQKLLFTWVQDPIGGRNVTYSGYRTNGAPPLNQSANTATIDQFVCIDGSNWRLTSRITGQ